VTLSVLGEDFSGGLFRCGFRGWSPAGFGKSLLVFAALCIGYILAQAFLAVVIQVAVFHQPAGDKATMALSLIVGLVPLAFLVVPVTWQAAKLSGGDPREVLNLHWPRLTLLGWIALIALFIVGVVVLFAAFLGVLNMFGIGPPGGGIVEETVSGIANEKNVVAMVVPALIFGAPVAEEFLFRGQIYTALSQTRAGYSGATILTSAGWSVLHYSGDLTQVALIFILGLVLGWLLYRFGSIFVTIACHSAWNGLVSMALLGAAGPPT
jgi:membrane protease YdiL (CAAX protease family)